MESEIRNVEVPIIYLKKILENIISYYLKCLILLTYNGTMKFNCSIIISVCLT